jgi:hypothetical protein
MTTRHRILLIIGTAAALLPLVASAQDVRPAQVRTEVRVVATTTRPLPPIRPIARPADVRPATTTAIPIRIQMHIDERLEQREMMYATSATPTRPFIGDEDRPARGMFADWYEHMFARVRTASGTPALPPGIERAPGLTRAPGLASSTPRGIFLRFGTSTVEARAQFVPASFFNRERIQNAGLGDRVGDFLSRLIRFRLFGQ